MRKLFLKISMLLFLLGMSTNAAWANLDQLPAQQLAQLTRPVYKAQMTGYTSSTGGGKVYITLAEGNPRCEDNSCWTEGTSNVALFGLGITTVESIPMTKANFRCWAQKNPGYFFTGWSFSNLGTDLANDADNVYTCSVSTSMDSTVIAYYTIYGTFEPIRIADYAISDGNTTAKLAEERYCEQTVVFSLYGDHISTADFKEPTVTGTPGTWAVTSWNYGETNSEKVTVNVKFVAPDDNVAEYSANLLLETQAGIKMNVPLAARTITPGVEAIRYNKNKVKQGEGSLVAMIAAAASTDVIKLNGDYASAVTIGKSLTLDLNGYTLNNKLTVSDGDVVIAYSKYGGTINGTTGTAIDLQGGTLTLNGGHITASAIGVNIAAGATLNQNGATIEAASAILNNGTLETTDGTAIGTSQCAVGASNGSTTTINGGSFLAGTSNAAVQIAGATAKAYIKKGTIASSTVAPYSQYGVGATDGAYVEIEKLAVINGYHCALKTENGGSILVKGGKFNSPSDFHYGTTSDVTLNTAYFRYNNDYEQFKDKHLWRNTSGAEFREGYNYLAGEYSDAQAAGVSICHIGATSYTTLEDALAFANTTNESLTIILDNDYTLPAGYYTIPSNATLLIPYKDENVSVAKIVERETSYETPYKFRKLTLSDGVNWNVHGTIEVGGVQSSTAGTNTGAPMGAYGQLQINAGSRVILQNGATLRAWGYVTGDIEHKNTTTHEVPMGEIDVRRGAKVYEMFEMGDWGSTISAGAGLMTNDSIFPLTHYFIQNVEVPTKYHPGAELISVTSVTELSTITMCANDIQIIGVSGVHTAMFLMNQEADAENTWVRKWYNPVTDQQVYEVNSGAHIGQLVIPLVSSEILSMVPQVPISNNTTVGDLLEQYAHVPQGTPFPTELVMNSGQYFLPLTTNFKIHVLTGTLDFTQSTELLPGCELEIDKEATVLITDEDKEGVQEGSLFIYDYRDWGNFAYGAIARKVSYSPVFGDAPSTRDISTAAALGSAKINVHGTFDTEYGYVFTTGEDHGGNIFSSVEDAGTFKFTVAAKAANYSEDIVQLQGNTRHTIHCYPAYLKNSAEWVANGNDEYAHTGGTAANTSYCYLDIDGNGGHWTLLEQDGCFVHDALNNIYYIKPQEYVALANGKTANADHTYSDAAGAGRLFILMTDEFGLDCQWWEVEAKENYFHCIHPDNDTYYEWDGSKWVEKKFTITWKDWDGSTISTYSVSYGTQAEWLSTNPTRLASIDYTYDFTGWTPALGPVTSDVTYTATYEAKQIKYTITFEQDGGVEIERHLLARNEMPVCENVPTRTGYTLEWSPALAAVTGNQTYTATWLPEPPTEYEIKFMDYDGTTELQKGSVAVGTVPTPPENPTGKPATPEFTYVFDHWSPALEEVSATSAKVYTAVYREVAREYTIYYFKEDGVTPNATKASESLPYGATPTPPTVSKEDPENGHTYTLIWKNLAETATIQTVTGNASYKPTYLDAINKYQVSVMSNPSGACAISGAGIYNYNASATAVTITITPNSGYTFTGWSDGQGGTNTTRLMAVTGDINLVANFTVAEPDYTITWKNEAGTANLVDPVGQKANTATIYTGAIPTKDPSAQYVYTFDGWTTAANGEGTFYKNNMTPKATANATYYAHFAQVVNQYTIYWKNEAGTANIEVDYDQPYGAAIAYNSATPTKQATAAATYAFDGWSTSVGGDVVALPATVSGNATYYAHFAKTTKTYTITWKRDDGSLIESSEEEYGAILSPADPTKPATAEYTYEFVEWSPAVAEVTGVAVYTALFDAIPLTSDLEIGIGESEDLDHAEVERTNLVITSNGVDASGQLLGAEHLSITGEAIFRLEQDFDAETWYAVAVPWTVALSGIRDNDGNAFASGNVYVIEFDASAYASADRDLGRTDYWKFLDETGNDMQPGKLYMIWFKYAQTPAVEFHKKEGASLWTTSTSVAPASGSFESQKNWNAIANPALYYADMTIADTYGDVLKYNGNDVYVVAGSTNMVVGQPIFAQVSTPSTVAATPVGGGSSPAPYHRAPQTATEANNRFVVELTQNGNLADRMIVQTAEEKANEYVIGKDLAKMSVSTKVAQMWMERYDAKLCKNTVEMAGDHADYPMGISAPVSGEYTLSAMQQRGDEVLYLTRNGQAIWNLSESDFVLSLEQGTTFEYGLRVSAKAPQVATGVDEAVVDAKGNTRKVIINNQVFIIRGDQVYTIDGQLIR